MVIRVVAGQSPVISVAISIHFHMIKYIFDHCGLLTFQNGLLLFHDGGHFSFTSYIYSCLGKVLLIQVYQSFR